MHTRIPFGTRRTAAFNIYCAQPASSFSTANISTFQAFYYTFSRYNNDFYLHNYSEFTRNIKAFKFYTMYALRKKQSVVYDCLYTY